MRNKDVTVVMVLKQKDEKKTMITYVLQDKSDKF